MRIPASVYRLQLSAEFTLDDVARLIPYFADLGVDWLSLSPILQSADGSPHGYDVVDPSRVDRARGGRDALVRLAAHAHRAGMGLLVDIVPNHLGVRHPRENPWWWEVLAHGPRAEFARFFDIDWRSQNGKLLLPVLGDADMPQQPGAPIRGMRVDRAAGVLRYRDREYPLAAGSADNPDASIRQVHEAQHYELVHWRRAEWDLNYRCGCALPDLAGIRVEDAEVWQAAHAEVLSWVREGLVDGLRVTRVDDLRDPAGYLAKLREQTGVYVCAEKILSPGELLPSWAGPGTTGYDALGEFDRVLIDPNGQHEFTQLGDPHEGENWETLVHSAKRFVADGALHAQLCRVAQEINDPTLPENATVDALGEIAACLPVARTYLPEGQEYLERATQTAICWRADLRAEIIRVAQRLRDTTNLGALRFQQITGTVLAKAVEDRAFFRYAELTSLNELGSNPVEFAISPERFTQLQGARLRQGPSTQTVLSSHDTKHSEDVRARLDALSEVPELWRDALETWREIVPLSSPVLESLLWQSIIGVWPASRQRLYAHAEKVAREAGETTRWGESNRTFEQELRRVVDAAFDHPAARALIQNVIAAIEPAGWSNSLSMKALQLLGPGIPEVYQGTELWRHTLADPDNRAAVSWPQREAALKAILAGARPNFDATDLTGASKLLLTVVALRLRRSMPERFCAYTRLRARGAAAEHLLAIDRGRVLVLATRLPIGLAAGGGWHDSLLDLPQGSWVDQFTGQTHTGSVSVAKLLQHLPVGVFVRAE